MRHPEGAGERRDVVEGEATLAGLQAAQRRDVDVRRRGDLLERQAARGAQLAQTAPHPLVDILGCFACMATQVATWRVGRHDRGMDRPWDCIVIGGGAAGLSAALVLGRARRRTLVVDDGRQSNLAAHGIGGLLGHDGRPPADLYAAARAELAAYPSVELVTGTVVAGRPRRGRLPGRRSPTVTGTRRDACSSRRGWTTGHPTCPGLAERWGRSVFHCPFCHGWEVRDRPLGVLDNGANAVHRALLLRAWSDDVTVLTDGPPELDDDALAQLAAAGVSSTSAASRPCAGRAPI